jgi:hypothetical protein
MVLGKIYAEIYYLKFRVNLRVSWWSLPNSVPLWWQSSEEANRLALIKKCIYSRNYIKTNKWCEVSSKYEGGSASVNFNIRNIDFILCCNLVYKCLHSIGLSMDCPSLVLFTCDCFMQLSLLKSGFRGMNKYICNM